MHAFCLQFMACYIYVYAQHVKTLAHIMAKLIHCGLTFLIDIAVTYPSVLTSVVRSSKVSLPFVDLLRCYCIQFLYLSHIM